VRDSVGVTVELFPWLRDGVKVRAAVGDEVGVSVRVRPLVNDDVTDWPTVNVLDGVAVKLCDPCGEAVAELVSDVDLDRYDDCVVEYVVLNVPVAVSVRDMD